MIDSSLRVDLFDYNKAVITYENRLKNAQIKDVAGGIVISGVMNNQMVSNLNVEYAVLKYKNGAILIQNSKFTSVGDTKTFNQILSTFKFLP